MIIVVPAKLGAWLKLHLLNELYVGPKYVFDLYPPFIRQFDLEQ
jgi:hypothetical protein